MKMLLNYYSLMWAKPIFFSLASHVSNLIGLPKSFKVIILCIKFMAFMPTYNLNNKPLRVTYIIPYKYTEYPIMSLL